MDAADKEHRENLNKMESKFFEEKVASSAKGISYTYLIFLEN